MPDMEEIEVTLEIPVEEGGAAEFPDAAALPRRGEVGRVAGLDGDQVLQLTVLVSAGTLGVLRVWLRARAERLKHARAVLNGRVYDAYTPGEIERLERLIARQGGFDEAIPSAGAIED
jgi:hypothetical protein